MANRIEYGTYVFEDDHIDSANLFLAASLLSSQLQVNSFRATVRCADPSILDFQRNSKLTFFSGGRQRGIFCVQSIERVAPELYDISATSVLGLLTEGQHMGGIYTGQTAEEVIGDICGSVLYIVKTVLAGVKLYGWLPIATPRDNLSQVLFAIGAALRTDLDGVLRIAGLWDGISGQAPQDRMYEDATVDYSAKITQVIVTEHQYIAGNEEKQLFEGTSQAGDVITFDGPMHSLTATGFSIQASGANWARVSAGTGMLSGKTYIHNTRQVTRNVNEAATPNVKTVDNATLVSLVNSTAVAKRLADYYKCRERVDAQVVYRGELPGDRLATYHPFNKMGVDACLESADITISGVLASKAKLLVGYVPPKAESVEYFDRRELFTEDAVFIVPDGVYNVRLVEGGGGDGGLPGKNGTGGTSGGTASLTGNSGLNTGSAGSAGKGGLGGAGGQGGKVNVLDLEVEPGDELRISIGVGGSSGAPGGNTVVSIYRGGELIQQVSSAEGSASPLGYTDTVTGDVYATSGDAGIAGADGGAAGNENIDGQDGGSVGSYSGGAGRTDAGAATEVTNTGPYVFQNYTQSSQYVSNQTIFSSLTGYSSYKVDSEGIVDTSGYERKVGVTGGSVVEGTIYKNPQNGSVSASTTSTIEEYVVTKASDTQAGVKKNRITIFRQYKQGKTTTYTGILPSGGGGAANGKSGGNATATSGGDGASPPAPAAATVPGGGGRGGSGGGGGGGGGGGYVQHVKATSADYPDYSVTAKRAGASGGTAGSGSPGGRGANGFAILYFGEPKKIGSGQLVDKNGKMVLDRFRRRVIV